MKAIKCEMCGGIDLLKEDGVFICQSCGVKYSLEEAKKLLIDGRVQIDNSERINNLYILARRAKENDNVADAQKYYDEIRSELPNDWESNFYAVYYKAKNCKLGEIYEAANSVTSSIPTVFQLIDASTENDEERINAFTDVCESSFELSEMLSNAEQARYDDIDSSIRDSYSNEHNRNMHAISAIRLEIFEAFQGVYRDDEPLMRGIGLDVLKYRVEKYYYGVPTQHAAAIIKKYEPDYNGDKEAKERKIQIDKEMADYKKKLDDALEKYNPEKLKSNGCYIATCVYGSYDCSEVWTLRRFRDSFLAISLPGRLFIKVYYAISPKLVSAFGETKWFKIIWRRLLDKMVMRLTERGYEDTPYSDPNY